MPEEFPSAPDASTNVRLSFLRDVDPSLFDKVWKIIQECGQYERHFNTLQGVYRGLASTWLLAMFGGIGFVLKEEVKPTHTLIALAGVAATVGIFVLWSLDTNVYHRLLLAVFYDGREFERACLWLPPVRNRMKEPGNEHAVRRSVCWFYTGLMLVTGAVAVNGAYFASRSAVWPLVGGSADNRVDHFPLVEMRNDEDPVRCSIFHSENREGSSLAHRLFAK